MAVFHCWQNNFHHHHNITADIWYVCYQYDISLSCHIPQLVGFPSDIHNQQVQHNTNFTSNGLSAWTIRFLPSYVPSRSRHFWGVLSRPVSLWENSTLLWSPSPCVCSYPIFPHSVSTPHSLFFASIIKYPTLRNLNNATQMGRDSCSFSQSLAVSSVLKAKRKRFFMCCANWCHQKLGAFPFLLNKVSSCARSTLDNTYLYLYI